jgi:hypothetical protein
MRDIVRLYVGQHQISPHFEKQTYFENQNINRSQIYWQVPVQDQYLHGFNDDSKGWSRAKLSPLSQIRAEKSWPKREAVLMRPVTGLLELT